MATWVSQILVVLRPPQILKLKVTSCLSSLCLSLGKKTYNFLDWFLVEDISWGSDLNVPSLGTGLLIKLRLGCVCLNTW